MLVKQGALSCNFLVASCRSWYFAASQKLFSNFYDLPVGATCRWSSARMFDSDTENPCRRCFVCLPSSWRATPNCSSWLTWRSSLKDYLPRSTSIPHSALVLISNAVRACGGISITSLVCKSGALCLAEARRSSLDTALLLLLLPSALLAKDDVAVPHLGLRVPLLQAKWFFTAQTPSSVGRCSREPCAGADGGGVAGTRGLSSVREQTGAQWLRWPALHGEWLLCVGIDWHSRLVRDVVSFYISKIQRPKICFSEHCHSWIHIFFQVRRISFVLSSM